MEDQVTITVDGRELRVPKGELLWEACKSHGIDIPIFCYHTKLGAVGACRTCLVEVEGMTKGPITACSTPVTDGMVVRTRSPIAAKAQRGIMEFLLLNHPLDCPICDRAGECPLQDQVFAYGPGQSRYIEPKRHHVKPIVLGPTIALDRERCVLCWRCVRFCAEIAEDKSIVLLDRGDHTVVGTFQDEPYVSNFSGNVVELCPVGALTSRKQRFNFRPWELENRPSICPHCAFGCNINVSVRKNDEVIRFLSRDNPAVDDSWLCDRGRYGFEFINSPTRLTAPLIREGDRLRETSWTEALEYIAVRLAAVVEERGGDSVMGIASARLTNEDLFVFRRFMTDVVGTANVDHFPRPRLILDEAANQAASNLADRVVPIAELQRAKTIILLGANPSVREPVMELRIRQAINKQGARLVVMTSDEISLSSKAAVDLRIPAVDLAAATSELASLPGGDEAPGSDLGLVARLLSDGPTVVIYDDTFDSEVDASSALVAIDALVSTLAARGDAGVIPLLDECNSMGARDQTILPGGGWNVPLVDLIAAGKPGAVFIFGADVAGPYGSEMARRLADLDLVVVSDMMLTETARLADVVLPAASFAEKVGTFTNTERRIQMLSDVVPSPGIARPEWRMLVDLSQYFPAAMDYGEPEEIWRDIRVATGQYAGIDYEDIGMRGVLAASPVPV